MGSSNTSFTTKCCASASMTFLAGGISWSVESITAYGKDNMIACMPYLNYTSQMTREIQEKFEITGVPAGHTGFCEGDCTREEAKYYSRISPSSSP